MNTLRLTEMFGLDGKVAVVTDSGALSSVDVAPVLADAGATVVIADRDAASAAALAERIVAAGGRAQAIATDIEDEAQVKALFAQVGARYGHLDILVNCAGATANQPLLETTTELFDAMLSVNLRSVFWCMREAVRLMLDNGGGRIVNITTMGALHPVLHGNQAYGSARAGVTMLTKTTAMDHAKDGILANVVMPGAIGGKVRFHDQTRQAMAAGYQLSGPAVDAQRRLPLGMGSGADIASAVLYLAGPAGRYITGQAIVLDGGFLSA
ncbi:SDR family NAD(P)-dependent oxidoreductase [Ideonella sp. B508-1]|uniref:SDR family NAD(P)-dependent oxidoreductase n=1 Tax=Ideonella sp. B508-1 TaxID=137716 RepID=UPI000348121B|nr:SDR family oxidoreductase [Ideonella sp. B508-1]